MKLLQAIAEANALRPNALPDSIKANWIYKLECEVAELMDIEDTGEEDSLYPKNTYPQDCDLLMPSEKDDIYALYVCALIDNAIEDTQLYVNDMTIFNSAKDDAFRWWRRHHMKKCNQYIRAFPWQPPIKGVNDETTRVTNQDTETNTTDVPTTGD